MMELVIVVALAFVLGYKVSQGIHLITFRKILRDLGIKESQLRKLAENHGIEITDTSTAAAAPDEPQHIEIKVERHGSELYAFRTDTDEFLAQGPDRDTLVQRIADRFTNTRFTVAKDQGAEYLK